MISFKAFINAIHEAVVGASDSLMEKNVGLLDRYFDETKTEEVDPVTKQAKKKNTLVPKSVSLEYPRTTAQGIQTAEVQVPLITLVPLQMSKIEKATLTANFEMQVVNGELQLNFTNSPSKSFFKKSKTSFGKLEITIAPQETSEGLKLMVEGYEALLKQQIP
jgi:hypothetical protein